MTAADIVRVGSSFERHAQTALVLLLVALLLWVGNTTQITAVTVAEMRIEMTYLKHKIDEPLQDHRECAKQITDLRDRIAALERREHTK